MNPFPILKPIFFIGIFSCASFFSGYDFSFKKIKKTDFEKVKVDGGFVSGALNDDGDINIFKGIPFAAPPVGNLRWKKPQPVIAWNNIRECLDFGPSPMQDRPVPFGPWSEEYLIPEEPISEDCLYLNVWTGAASDSERRPVIVWIYGGGFSSGGSAVPVYDGEAMAKKGIVFVSLNYRVGIFGFFAHPDLTKESGNNASGNYGLMDQIAGLKWVQKNIAAFGGDPNNITIAGQSAGSMSVNCLVASPLCKGIFKKAIAESGASFGSMLVVNGHTLKQAEENGVKLSQDLHAKTIKELRAIPAEELLKKQGSVLRGPIVDGYVLPKSVDEIFVSNKQNNVALLTGWNEDDGVVFGSPKTAEQFKEEAIEQYGSSADVFLKLYPSATDAEAAISQAMYSRDRVFGVQNYTWANKQAEHGNSKVYVYRFTRKLPATGEYVKYGAFHTGEVAYAYDNLKFVQRCPWQTVDHELANTMSSYWANFAATGNPNGKFMIEWPAYNTQDHLVMFLGEKPSAGALPDKDRLDFLSKFMN